MRKLSTVDNSHKTPRIPRARANLQARHLLPYSNSIVKLLRRRPGKRGVEQSHVPLDNIELDQVIKDRMTVHQSIMNTVSRTHSVQLLRSLPCRLPAGHKNGQDIYFFSYPYSLKKTF
jgi:hypothetical protein